MKLDKTTTSWAVILLLITMALNWHAMIDLKTRIIELEQHHENE